MKQIIWRFAACLIWIALLGMSVSCGRSEGEVTADTSAAITSASAAITSASAETSLSSAVEPAAGEAAKPAAEALCEVFNRQVEILFAEETSKDGVDAEEMLDAMLPYLMGGEEDLSASENYHMSQITVTGDGIAMPEEIIAMNGVTLSQSTDPAFGVYREIEVSHENGVVYLSTFDGVTTADEFAITLPEESPMGELGSAAMALSAEHFVAETQENVWEISDLYTRQVLRALLGKETVASLKNDDMSCALDASAWETKGEMMLEMSLSAPAQIRLGVRLSGIGESCERMELTLLAAEENEITLSCALTDGVMDEMAMRIRMGESVTEVTQRVNGTHTDLTMTVKSGEVVTMSCKFALDMISETEGKGTVEVVFQADGNGIGDIMPLAADTESVALGEFTVSLAGGEIARMEMTVTARAGTTLSETEMKLVQTGAAVGESVMYYAVKVSDSADPALHTSLEMDVRLDSDAGEVSRYTMEITLTDALGTSTAQAAVTSPSDVAPSYSEQERRLIERAERFLQHYSQYEEEAQAAVDALVRRSESVNIAAYPSAFYLEDRDGDGIVILLQIVEDNGYYVYADILLDAENTTYWYSCYNEYFEPVQLSGFLEDRNWLYQTLHGWDDLHYEPLAQPNAIGYYYEAEQGIYIICDSFDANRCGYSLTEPTTADFPGRALHRVTVDESGNAVGDFHDMEITYDEHCVATQTCRACGFQIRAFHESHDDAAGVVIGELNGESPKTEFFSCSRCQRGSLLLTDAQGDSIRVLLEPASYATIAQENTFRYDPISWERVGMQRDLSDCVIISDMITESERGDGTFDCDIVIPDLRERMGLTILGIRFDDNAYRIAKKPSLTVVFPEGMEYIGCYGSTLFSYVTELILPETLTCLSDGALGGYAGERLVLPASLEYFADDGFHMLNLKSLTIKGAYYDISPYLWCPALEELICHGTFRVFRGFGTPCRIEEFTVPAGVEIIASYAFCDMRDLKKVTLCEGVTEIERQAFQNCTSLSEIVIPDSLERIGENAFMDCTSLVRIEMRGIREIGGNAFFGCTALEEVVVGDALAVVGRSAFIYCSALKRIQLPAAASVASDAFQGCTSLE